MTTGYPIIERRKLSEAQKKGLLRRQYRDSGELPKPDAHQVLVYRVNGQFVLDADRLRARDEQVVNATHVTVVDVRRNAPVEVRFPIPSADASSFEVFVTFVCAVTDPIAVVRGGIDAREALWGYLKSHNRIFELGLDYPLLDINEVRKAVSAQVTSYYTIKPPMVAGITVELASVEVGTPDDIKKWGADQRTSEIEQLLATKKLDFEYRLRTSRTLSEQALESNAQVHQQHLAISKQSFDRDTATLDAKHSQFLAHERAEFERREFARYLETIGSNPRHAALTAYAAGKIDATALSQHLLELDGVDRQQRELDLQRERDNRILDREEQWHRDEMKQHELEWQRSETRRKEDNDRAERLMDKEQARQDAMEHMKIRFELLKQAAAGGHLSMVNLGLDKIWAEVMGTPQKAVDSEPEAKGITVSSEARPAGDNPADYKSGQVREEDD